MKNILKQIYTYLIVVVCLLACTPTIDLNEVESESTIIRQRRSATSINNALVFDSIAQADALLEQMLSIDSAEVFYENYIQNFGINNRYLNSIYEYMCIWEEIEKGDSINALLALRENQGDLLNIYVDGTDTVVEPLSCFDYRCLVNDDDVFIVNDRVYCLFDSIFITCTVEKYPDLVEISNNPIMMRLLVEELKTEKPDIPSISRTNIATDFEIIILYPYTGKTRYIFEKSVGKQRMQVIIDTEDKHIKYRNQHELKTKYMVKNHKKCLGIWWIQRLTTDVTIVYDAWFTYGRYGIAVIPDNLYVPMTDTCIVRKFYHSNYNIDDYPSLEIPYIRNNGIIHTDFTISNPYLTITEEDFKYSTYPD